MRKEIAVSAFLQDELRKRDLMSVAAVEAARWLDDAGLLKDSATRPGKPVRDLLRAEKMAGQRQEKNRLWFIDRAGDSKAEARLLRLAAAPSRARKASGSDIPAAKVDDEEAIKRFAKARAKYRPKQV